MAKLNQSNVSGKDAAGLGADKSFGTEITSGWTNVFTEPAEFRLVYHLCDELSSVKNCWNRVARPRCEAFRWWLLMCSTQEKRGLGRLEVSSAGGSQRAGQQVFLEKSACKVLLPY